MKIQQNTISQEELEKADNKSSTLFNQNIMQEFKIKKDKFKQLLIDKKINNTKVYEFGDKKHYISDDFNVYLITNFNLTPIAISKTFLTTRYDTEIALASVYSLVQDKEHQNALNEFLAKSQIPPIVINNFRDEFKCEASDVMRNWININNFNGLLFRGSTGLGKTQSSMILAKHCFNKGLTMRYTTFKQIFDLSYNNKTEYQRLLQCKVLFLDELILTKDTDKYRLQILHEIVDYRYSNLLKTVIVTNFTSNNGQVDRLSNLILPATTSRIVESYFIKEIAGKDLRFK